MTARAIRDNLRATTRLEASGHTTIVNDEDLADAIEALQQATLGRSVTIDPTWHRRAAWTADWADYQRQHAWIVGDALADLDTLRDRLHAQGVDDRRAIAAARPRETIAQTLSRVARLVHDAAQPLHSLVVSADVMAGLRTLATVPTVPGVDRLLGVPVTASSLVPPGTITAMPADPQ